MSRIRYRHRDEEPSTGTAVATLALGALAGFAVGVLVAQKAGGVSGIASRLRRRFADVDEMDDEPARGAGHAAEEELAEEAAEVEAAIQREELEEEAAEAEAAHEELEEEEAYGAEAGALEERVLEAFEDDAVLGERAIDISAVADGTIELSGWVDSDAEIEHAAAVTRAVDGVQSVVNRLAVGEPRAGHGTERDVEVDMADETAPPPRRRRSRRPPRDDAAESDAGA